MFKLSLAFSAATLVAAQVDLIAFCDLLVAKCPNTHGALTAANCNAAFASMDLGTETDVNVNSVGCRLQFVNTTTPDCRYAGPSGGGRCGAVVDGVCTVATAICSQIPGASYTTVSDCVTGLTETPSLRHQWGSKQGADAVSENSLECRSYHAIASFGDSSHCGHFNKTGGPCSGPVSPNATHYCDVLQNSCTGNVQFAQKAQCMQVAAGFTPGLSAEESNTDNTLACREYHAQAAAVSPNTHCAHAGPSGGGVCGLPTEAWGSILAAAPCSDPHVNVFLSSVGDAAFVDTLVPSGLANAKYNTTLDNSGNTQACRIYHLGVASTATSHCSHGYLSGGGACGNYIDNFCTLAQTACGFGANATWQFASLADCKTQMAGLANGITKPQDVSNNTYECRFYHATVAAGFAPGGKNAAAAGAAASRVAHCSHTLKMAAAGGCGYMAPTAAPAPTPAAGAASALSVLTSLLVVAASVSSL